MNLLSRSSSWWLALSLGLVIGCSTTDTSDTSDTTDTTDTSDTSDTSTSPDTTSPRFPADLMLIYQGDHPRTAWRAADYAPYVARLRTTSPDAPQPTLTTDWLFDGFLFLALSTTLNDTTYYLDGDPARGSAMATRLVWADWLNTIFSPTVGLDALNAAIASWTTPSTTLGYRHKVILAIPYPVRADHPWGAIAGSELHFTRHADRLAAVTWFIDEALARWNANSYPHLELAGFYWLREEAFSSEDAALISDVSAAIARRNGHTSGALNPAPNLDFYWIPYNAPPESRSANWQELGFDIAHFQPNYFFTPTTPPTVLDDAITFALNHGMGLELEFTGQIYGPDEATYLPRLNASLDAFEARGIWADKPVAYYDSAGAWRHMVLETVSPAVARSRERLAAFLTARKARVRAGTFWPSD